MGEQGPTSSLESLSSSLESLPIWGKTLVVGGAALALYLPISWYRSGRYRESPIKKDYKKDVVYLYQLPTCTNCPSISSSCLKLETWLRIAEVEFEKVPIPLSVRGLDGAIPFIELNGKEYSHSANAIKIISDYFEVSLESHLNEEQKAICTALERLTERSLDNSHHLFRAENADKLLACLPPNAFGIFGGLFKRLTKQSYIGQCASALSSAGFGSYTREDRIEIGSEDIRALSKYLGSRHYFTGFKPVSVDAAIFGVLVQIAFAPYESVHFSVLQNECRNLLDFIDRIRKRFWPDWTSPVESSVRLKWAPPARNGISPRGITKSNSP